MASIHPAAAADPSNPKRPAADAMAPDAPEGSPAMHLRAPLRRAPLRRAKRRRTVVPAAALAAKIAALEAAVARSKARKAAQDQRIAGLEADNARLSNENATLRKLPEPPATLQHLVGALNRHEQDLRDCVFELACMPWHLASREVTCRRTPLGFWGHSRSPFRPAPSGSSGAPSRGSGAWRR